MEAVQQLLITKERIIAPLEIVSNETTPKTSPDPIQHEPATKSIRDSLDALFPEQQREEKNIQKAKDTLGALASQFSQEQLKEAVTEIQYLVDSWLDDLERKTFSGQTLNELLHEKGGQ